MGRGQIEEDIEELLDRAKGGYHKIRDVEEAAREVLEDTEEVTRSMGKTAAEVAGELMKMLSEEEKLELLEACKRDGFLPIQRDDMAGPKWDKPFTWAMASGDTFERGDGILVKDRIFIVLRRMRFRRRCANILCQDVNDPTRYWRAGTIDYLPRFANYVHYQQSSRWGVEL